jgi:hypothetical protein
LIVASRKEKKMENMYLTAIKNSSFCDEFVCLSKEIVEEVYKKRVHSLIEDKEIEKSPNLVKKIKQFKQKAGDAGIDGLPNNLAELYINIIHPLYYCFIRKNA